MPKLLLIVFVAFLVWLAVRVLGTGRKRRDDARAAASPALPTVPEPIRQCAWCGVHVPVGQSVGLPDGRLYCGVPHREAAAAASTGRSRA